MGKGFCHWDQGLCMVLAACLVFCLGPGVEALRCRECSAENDQSCRSQEKTCEESRDNAVCLVGKKYKGDRLTETFMKCTVDDAYCGLELTIPEENPEDTFRLDRECCSERDFCSDDMLSA